ncbi:MAG: hypothetical protein JWR42_999, partial [Marmoricola sp.]|nr:hypothetical protein [Marmoricola sp.]
SSSQDRLTLAATSLQQEVTVTNDADTTVLAVSVQGARPADAQELTNAVSQALATQIEDTEKGVNNFAPIRASVINGAEVPQAPSSPKPYLNAVLGAGFGFALAAALSILLATRPERTRSTRGRNARAARAGRTPNQSPRPRRERQRRLGDQAPAPADPPRKVRQGDDEQLGDEQFASRSSSSGWERA